jgi:hypothetical protein
MNNRNLRAIIVSFLYAAFAVTAGAQTTYTDNFSTPVNYLTGGVAGTMWDGVYLGAGAFANATSTGAAPGTISVADAGITANNALTIASLQTDWENSEDDGAFLFKVITGDFDMSVQIIGPTGAGAYNLPGLMVRAFGTNGSPEPNNAENSFLWARFEWLNHVNMLKNNVNGVKADTTLGAPAPNANYWLRVTRSGNVFTLYEKGTAGGAWTNVGTLTRADFSGLPLQVGLEQSDYAGGATQTAQFAGFNLTAANMGPFAAAPSPVTGLVLKTNLQGNILASWVPGSGSAGSLVVVWTGTNGGGVQEAPANGYAYTGNAAYGSGSSLPGLNYYAAYSGSGTNVTINNLTPATVYQVAVFSYSQPGGAVGTVYNHTPATGSLATPGLPAGSVEAQAQVEGTNVMITFNSNPPKWYLVQYTASLSPANWENLFTVPVQATNFLMSYLHAGGAVYHAGYYRVAQFDSPPPGVNLAPVATDLTSYVSPWQTLGAINDGYDPTSSGDSSQGAYGNWAGGGGNGTQWVEYDYGQPVTTAKIDVYWWQDGAGIWAPSSCQLDYWDGTNFDPVVNPVGLGVALNQYNTTTFNAVTTTKLRLLFTSDGSNSTGILQWKVYDTGASPNFPPQVIGDVDRDVVIGGNSYLNGAVADDGKLYITPAVTWSLASGPGQVTFANPTAAVTTAVGSGVGAGVVQLTAFDGQYYASNTLNLTVAPQFTATHPLPLYVDAGSYTISNSLWNYRLKKDITNWIPYLYSQLNNTNLAQGNINNFIQAGNKLAGRAYTVPNVDPWSDAYTLNTVEAMCYALNYNAQGDPGILAAQAAFRTNLAYWLPIILSAQQTNGYLHTYTELRDLGPWTINGDHEGYVGGYFIEACLAHYLMTGRTDPTMYNAAKKLADCWCANLGPGIKSWYDGHENMEQALVHLGRFVNEYEGNGKGQSYINLAKWLIDCRGTPAANAAEGDGGDYDQSQSPVNHQYEAVGHAVRAEYLYSGVADVAIETGSLDYQSAALSLWDNFVNKKYYVTGGAGSGATSEGFGNNYALPDSSYCETCAGCGTLFFFHKLNLAYQDAKYADLMENVLYNEILGAVDDAGTSIFYPNPLTGGGRDTWTAVPCCYGNFARTVLQLPTWTYTRSSNSIYLNLFIGSTMTISNVGGTTVQMVQFTDYPWTNTDRITVNPLTPANFTLYVREPNRTMSKLYRPTPAISGLTSILLNGAPITPPVANGYAVINRTWTAGDHIDLVLPMSVQRIKVNPAVTNLFTDNNGLVALQYGPLIYNIESADQTTGLVLNPSAPLSTQFTNILGGFLKVTGAWNNGAGLTAIPNYARLNRGGTSDVWFRDQ